MDSGRTTPSKQRCEACDDLVTPIPIVYGFPGAELFDEADAGRVRLGGCVVSDDDPQYACPACHEPFIENATAEATYRRLT